MPGACLNAFDFELVGVTRMLGIEDRPETIRRAIDFAFDFRVRIHEQFFERRHCSRAHTTDELSSNGHACLTYGEQLYNDLTDFCNLTGLKTVVP